jgi:hypothetical protein
VIQLSVLYARRKQLTEMLDLLNRYLYLYDERSRSKGELATAYNNRCYAHMELGELEKAVQDCAASLRFGSLPEAFAKQKRLVKRLDARAPLGDDGPS